MADEKRTTPEATTPKIEIDRNDPIQVEREQETKPSRTSSGPGETSVPKSTPPSRDLGTAEERTDEGVAPKSDASAQTDEDIQAQNQV